MVTETEPKEGRGLNIPVLLITLDFGVVDLAANETLDVKDSVFGARMESVLC